MEIKTFRGASRAVARAWSERPAVGPGAAASPLALPHRVAGDWTEVS